MHGMVKNCNKFDFTKHFVHSEYMYCICIMTREGIDGEIKPEPEENHKSIAQEIFNGLGYF